MQAMHSHGRFSVNGKNLSTIILYPTVRFLFFLITCTCTTLPYMLYNNLFHLINFIKDLGKRITLHTGDPLAPSHLVQCLAVDIQKGNSAPILGTASLAGG